MLIKVLKRLSQGGRFSNSLVAQELGVDESLIEQVITQLQQMGYIEKEDMGGNCEAGCDCGNSQKKGSCCSSNNIELNLWKITEKGKKTIKA